MSNELRIKELRRKLPDHLLDLLDDLGIESPTPQQLDVLMRVSDELNTLFSHIERSIENLEPKDAIVHLESELIHWPERDNAWMRALELADEEAQS